MPSGQFKIQTAERMHLLDITEKVSAVLRSSDVNQGIIFVSSPHTTAGITINEGADPDVQTDLIGALKQIVPASYPYRHREGNADSHIMTTLTGTSSMVEIESGRLLLGVWQRIFFCEFDGPRTRTVHWKILEG
ncbi:MAG: hypothetical protein CSA34_05425 [Desulfobulbus propionicus]|nr:MAG: hypothetical protein CSA34_05425 [Desulfobulbus propionicus]